jgi:Zn-dependent protease
MSSAAVHECPNCGCEIAPALLACPSCLRLVHSARLTDLVTEAATAQKEGDLSAALAHFRDALDLLPPETTQAATIRAQVEILGRQVDALGSAPRPRKSGGSSAGGIAAAVLGFLAMLVSKGKLLLIGLTKSGTFLSMFVFFAAYWNMWGWPFALGIVVSIYIHEMGHVDALRRFGFKATAPMFIPGLGAFVRFQQYPTNPLEDARIGLAGPLWGMAAALACYVIFLASGVKVWAAIAHGGALLNIFNLIAIPPLDGGRGFRPLSRGQATLVSAGFAVAWYLTNDGMLLLVTIIGFVRSMGKPNGGQGDRTAVFILLVLTSTLSAIVYLCQGNQ